MLMSPGYSMSVSSRTSICYVQVHWDGLSWRSCNPHTLLAVIMLCNRYLICLAGMQAGMQAAGRAGSREGLCGEEASWAWRERRVNKLQSPSRSHRLDPGVSYVSLVTQQAASGVITHTRTHTHTALPTMSVCGGRTHTLSPCQQALPANRAILSCVKMCALNGPA